MYNTSVGRLRIVPNTLTFNSPIICFFFVTVITLMLAGGCSKSPGFSAETYRAVDDKVVLKLFSSAEAELTEGGDHIVCQYVREGTRLRITMDALGTKRAFYYDIIPDGLRDERGVILYNADRYEVAAMRGVNVKATKTCLKMLHNAVAQFKMDTGRYPTEEEGLKVLIEAPTDVTGYQTGGYIDSTELPKDAWGHEFIYIAYPESGKPYVIVSYGADGIEGGEGANADLRSDTQVPIKVSKPVHLDGTGVSAAIPQGGGFQQISEGFSYEDNEFRLGTVLLADNQTAVSVHWRYFLLPIEQVASERFAEDANTLGGVLEYSKAKQFGQLTFDCAKIVAAKTATMLLTGTTVLPDGRTLTLEVVQKGRDFDMVDKVFNSVIASAIFKAESPLADGIKFLENFKQKDFADILDKMTWQNCYYIEDFTGKKLGFSTDAVGMVAETSKVNSAIVAMLYFFKSEKIAHTELDLFASEPNMHTFKWGNRQSDLLLNREIPTTIKLDETGMITIQKKTGMQNFVISRSMLPEILFDCAIESFLRSSFDAVMLDIIVSDGTIRPIIIKKAKVEADKFPDLKVTKAVEIKFFGSGAEVQTIYFNDIGEMLMSEVHGTMDYRLRRTAKENIIADFPEWAEKIERIKGYTVAADTK